MSTTPKTTPRSRRLVICGLSALLAIPVLAAQPSQAEADVRVRVRGSARVKVKAPRVRVRVRGPRARVHRAHRTHRPRTRLHVGGTVVVGGGIYVGTRYATPPPPPPPPAYDCDVPAYYSRPAAPVVVHPAPVHRPMGPRLGIGAFAGGVTVDGIDGDDAGLLARYRMTRGLALEGELSRTRGDVGESRRAGGALIWDLSPHRSLSPQLIGGLGGWNDGSYAEVGAGATWRMTDRFHLALDFRAGMHGTDDDETRTVAAGQVIDEGPSHDEPEPYTRGRLAAILYF